MQSSATENRNELLDVLVSMEAIDSKNARSIAVPQSQADIIELVSTHVELETLSAGLSRVSGMPLFNQERFEEVNFSDPEQAIRGGAGLNLWMLVRDEVFISNPYNQTLTNQAFDKSSNRHNIKDIGILPLSFTETETWKLIDKDGGDEDFVHHEEPQNKALAETKLDQIVALALEHGASDIHFVPNHRNEVDVRFRVDGSVLPMASYDLSLHKTLCTILMDNRCKVTYAKNEAQDGKFFTVHKGNQVNFRVATIPKKTRGKKSTKITVRVLDGDDNLVNLQQLGLSSENLKIVMEAFKEPQGMILVTGPTGSGKSTTLYSGLRYVSGSNPENTYYTVEDPVEQEVDNFIQIECNKFLTFATALRNLLRQDPDVIMLGEVRDSETANIAIELSNTGHLLCSTLHTKNGHETIGRIRDFDILPSVLAEALLIIVSQRLVKKLCKHCKVKVSQEKLDNQYADFKYDLSQYFTANEEILIYEANHSGCDHCMSGYKGRVGVTEVLVMDEELEDMILNNISPKEMRRRQIDTGSFKDLWHDAKRRISKGETSIEACKRVLGSHKPSRAHPVPRNTSKSAAKKLTLSTN